MLLFSFMVFWGYCAIVLQILVLVQKYKEKNMREEEIIVCQHHIGGEHIHVYPIEYPTVSYGKARKLGWWQTSNRIFNQDGGYHLVWICPDCVRWLDDYELHGPMWQAARGYLYPWQGDREAEYDFHSL